MYVAIGKRDEYMALVSREFKQKAPDKPSAAVASFETYFVDQQEVGVMWLNHKCLSSLVHECFHATHWLLSRRGMWLTDSSEDCYAYLLMYLFSELRGKL